MFGSFANDVEKSSRGCIGIMVKSTPKIGSDKSSLVFCSVGTVFFSNTVGNVQI
jgi:hypothetical protein